MLAATVGATYRDIVNKYYELTCDDSLPKAKALAEYAKKEDRIGRIQLIHKSSDAGGVSHFRRLDLTNLTVRDKVLQAMNNDELDHIFDTDGI
jgi:type III restriction enzyme